MRDDIVSYFEFIQSVFIEGNRDMFEGLSFEKRLKEYNPVSIIISMFIFLNLAPYIRAFIVGAFYKMNSLHKIKVLVGSLLINFSFVQKEIKKTRMKIKETIDKKLQKSKFHKLDFKDDGMTYEEVSKIYDDLLKDEKRDMTSGRITGGVYINNQDINKIAEEVASIYSYSDLKSPHAFPTARQIEAKVIEIGIKLFKGQKHECVGVTTSGGTESILSAILAYRNRGYEKGITQPELLATVYTHAAFQKACDCYNIKMIIVEHDKNTHKMDIEKLKKAINKNTVAVVGNFPNFPNGVCDDIDLIGEVCEERGVPLHVDACLGGMIIAFAEEAGIKGLPKCGFNLKGITSISCDYHKYGQCPKGISLLLYKNRSYRKYQYFKYEKLDGPCLTPGLCGTRNACYSASSLAIFLYNGRKFYVEQSRVISNEVVRLTKFTQDNLPNISVVGDPRVCVISWEGRKINEIYTKMIEKHWEISYIAIPTGFHIALTAANVGNFINKKFEIDLKECYDYVMANPQFKPGETVKMYGMSAAIPEELAKGNLDVLVDNMLE